MTDRKASESKGLCLPWNRAILDDIGSQGRLDSCVHLYPGGSQAVSSWVSEVTALCLCLLRGSWAPQDLPLDPGTPEKRVEATCTLGGPWASFHTRPGGLVVSGGCLSTLACQEHHMACSLTHTFSGKMPESLRLAGPRTAFDSTQPTECN